ncbi:helix-turn-helix transcriptional regulator [Lactobacillus sp. ESL0681]|uniref:helix-turn-helix domain-containing protein n=1 Tax=Lactobacillus sp. ESL0681 TaxID=2983211 RepID=UPI0023F63424|nr:helix-turn-helix transcriptional regulator [Lactobacillus sp. ESL0681]WEV40974.1 helix-turn-helix transcriptional regulator [Lactobacillus sp. ESL0681]
MKLNDIEGSFSSISEDEKVSIDTMAKLYAERIRRNIPQVVFAKKIGMKQPQLAKLEMLDSVPTLATLNRYAKGLGLKLEIDLVSA